MKIDLSKHEVELLLKAIDAWESAPTNSALIGGLLTVTLGSRMLSKEDIAAQLEKEKTDGEEASRKRRVPATMLRAKLYQAQAVDSEHDLSEERATPPPVHNP